MPLRPLLTAFVLLLGCSRAFAFQECQGWDPQFSSTVFQPEVDGPVYASAVFDDGSGPKLYIGGEFGQIGTTLCRGIACWDGERWTSVGGVFSPQGLGAHTGRYVRTLAVYDDGSGPALYAGGHFSLGSDNGPFIGIARFDGVSWSIPGGGLVGIPCAMAVYDDGGGSKLYVGGGVSSAGGNPVLNIVRWDGTSWSGVGAGLTGLVDSLAVYDEGAGPKLFAGSLYAQCIERWDGASWSAVGTGITAPQNGGVYALAVHDDGSGMQLYAGGYFLQAGGQNVFNVARWNGLSWSSLASGVSGQVHALARFDDGTGTKLYAGGTLWVSGQPENGFYRWDGAGWSGVGGGVTGGAVESLTAHDDGAGPRLFVGGTYTGTGTLNSGYFSTWTAAGWSLVGTPSGGNGANGIVMALAAHDDGSGPALFAGGYFGAIGGQAASRIARWDGRAWSALGGSVGPGEVDALASFDDGSGLALYAGGAFTNAGGGPASHVARWDGVNWSPLAAGLSGTNSKVYSLAVFDDGSGRALYAGGTFSNSGGVPMLNIARWDGTNWSALGSGVGGAADYVYALAVYDDGSGPALYAGGHFAVAGGVPASNIARWDGTNWSALGSGVTLHSVYALCVFDDGTGPGLYAGGWFEQAGGIPANALARWNGNSWAAVPGAFVPLPNSGISQVFSLRVVDDGSGPALSVGGAFSAVGGATSNCLARWNGQAWSGVDRGVGDYDPVVVSQEFFDDGSVSGADLYVGGGFFTAGGYLADNIARWNSCAQVFEGFCAGDGVLAACPCANSGMLRHGCENSAGTGGARLEAAGLTGNDTVQLNVTGMLPSALSIFLQGQNAIAPVFFGDGLRCVAGNLKRLYVVNASGGAASVPQPGAPSIRLRSAALGDPILQGQTRRYQTYYRDPSASFCPAPQGSTFNVSNGLSIRW